LHIFIEIIHAKEVAWAWGAGQDTQFIWKWYSWYIQPWIPVNG